MTCNYSLFNLTCRSSVSNENGQKNHSLQPLLPPLAHFVHRDVGIDYLLVDAVDAIPCGFRQAQSKAFFLRHEDVSLTLVIFTSFKDPVGPRQDL
jgi:hypothetical protein